MNYERLFADVFNYVLYSMKFKEKKLQKYENTLKEQISKEGRTVSGAQLN